MRCSEPGHRVLVAIHASRAGRVAELGSLDLSSPSEVRFRRYFTLILMLLWN
jgi:hypothetical protein